MDFIFFSGVSLLYKPELNLIWPTERERADTHKGKQEKE